MGGVRERGSVRTNVASSRRFRESEMERRRHKRRHCERRDLSAEVLAKAEQSRVLPRTQSGLLRRFAPGNNEANSIRRETIEQPVAARALQISLRAAAIGAARGVRAVPGL